MPGLLVSNRKADTGWVFDLRDTSTYDIDSDSETIEDRTTAAANKRTSQAKLLKDLDLSAREDTAVYKPNPWTIAKVNSACRPSSCASFAAPATGSTDSTTKAGFLSTTAATNRHSSASFVNKTCHGVSAKSVQTTLDKLFTVEKAGVVPKRAISETAKLSSRKDNSDAFTSIDTSRRVDRQPIVIPSNKATVGIPEMDLVTLEDTSSPAPTTLLKVYHDEPTQLQASKDHRTLNLSPSVDPVVSIPGKQMTQQRPYMLSDYPNYSLEYPVETNDKQVSTSKDHGSSNLSVSVDPIVPIPSEHPTQGHTSMLSDCPDYLSVDPIVSMPDEQPTQKHAYMRSNYEDYLSEEEDPAETNVDLETDQTEWLAGVPDATVGSEWARTLKCFREELLNSSRYTRGLDHTRGISDPARDCLPERHALSDHVPNVLPIQYSPNSSDQNSRGATLPPPLPSVRRRTDIHALSPLGHPNNSTTELSSRLTRSSEDDDDSTWSTLPTRRHRNKPVKTKTFFKHSGTFKLPLSALRSTKSLVMDSSVVAGTTQNLSNGKRLTFYKPPPRKQFDAADEPVILRIRKGNRQDWNKVTE